MSTTNPREALYAKVRQGTTMKLLLSAQHIEVMIARGEGAREHAIALNYIIFELELRADHYDNPRYEEVEAALREVESRTAGLLAAYPHLLDDDHPHAKGRPAEEDRP